MTTAHHRPTRTTGAGTHRGLSSLGTILAALPLLAGVVAAVMALGGRFGGPHNVLTTLWYVPAATAWLAVPGAVILLVVHHAERHVSRRLWAWTAVAAGGWLFALGTATLTGLAHAANTDGMVWQQMLLVVGMTAFVIGLVGLAVTGVRATMPEDEFY